MSERLPRTRHPYDEDSTVAGALLIVCLVMVPVMATIAWVLF